MIELGDDNTYHLGIWVMEMLDPDDQDIHVGNVMMSVKRQDDNFLNWDGDIRIRFYTDDSIFDSDDVRQFYKLKIEGKTESQVLTEAILNMSKMKELFCGDSIDFIEVKGGYNKVIEKLKDHPLFHLKTISKEEFEEKYK